MAGLLRRQSRGGGKWPVCYGQRVICRTKTCDAASFPPTDIECGIRHSANGLETIYFASIVWFEFESRCTPIGREAMRNLIEQADASRQSASELRRLAIELEVPDLIVTLKQAERLEVRAAELEYRWISIGSTLKSKQWWR
jgi:hypothetical protein